LTDVQAIGFEPFVI